MARIIDGSGGGNETHGDNAIVKISAHGADKIDMPDGMALADATMTRDGMDLVLTANDGSAVVIESYFAADPAPVLAGMNGASLSPELVNSFLTSAPEYAQSATASDNSPVGAVEEIKGDASVTRADGTTEKLTLGSPIYEGDIIQTDAQGAVNVVFIDETSMAVSANARMAVDAYSFDPATESGTTNFSVLRGVFVFTSGLIGRDDPDDVQIDTPVGSIGIRGTIIAGHINPNGESEITVVEGAIVVKNAVMEKTLAAQFETIRLGGIDSEMTEMGVLSAKAVGTAFGAVSDVAPSLFNAINDAAKEQGQNSDGANGRSDSNTEDSGETDTQNTQPDSSKDPAQDMQMNDLNAPFKTDVFKEAAVKNTGTATAHETTTVSETLERPAAAAIHEKATGAIYIPDAPVNAHHHTNTTNSNTNTGNTDPGTNPGGGGGTIVGPTPPTALELTTASATEGVSMIGHSVGSSIGYTATGVGDANNDGYADIMFSAGAGNQVYASYGATSGIKSGMVEFLKNTAITKMGWDNSAIAKAGDLGIINNPNLFSATDAVTNIVGIGDFDGDGIEDYLIGQPYIDAGMFNYGAAMIVSGADPTRRISVEGVGGMSLTGKSIAALGDINNDGYDDVLIGAPGSGTIGAAAVLFGGPSNAWGYTQTVMTMTGSQGRTLAALGSDFGASVAGIGDFNGDGYNDFAVGSPGHDYYHSGQTYTDSGSVTLYSGHNTNPVLTVHSTTANTKLGSQIVGLGDINGDGKSDIMIAGDNSFHSAYIVYGGAATNVNVDSMGSAGFKFDAGVAILGGGTAGDFNGDGYNDFVFALANGADADIYIVYGGSMLANAIGGDGVLSVSDLNANENYTFKMTYQGGGSLNFDLSSAGDVNGDGFDDLLIGAGDADGGNGQVIVVNGRGGGNNQYVTDGSAHDAQTTTGHVGASGSNEIVMGTENNDTLYTNDHDNIVLNGGRGNDVFVVGENGFKSIDGGFGIDTVRLSGAGSLLDLSGVHKLNQVEALEFSGPDQTIKLSVDNIFNLLKSSDTGELKISMASGATGSILQIDANGTHSGTTDQKIFMALLENSSNVNHMGNTGGYETFDIGGYTLYIDNMLMANAQVV